MKQLGSIFSSLFGRMDSEAATRKEIYREWDRQRRKATGPTDLAEIDAIFSRAL